MLTSAYDKPRILTETIRYADGPSPRYDGLISSRSRDSHTYTYSYDSHKRLVGAQYSNPDDTRADYSESYTYNAADPINHTDPTGMEWIDNSQAERLKMANMK